MKSMTGYGIGIVEEENVSIKVEIRAVNSRFTDINIRLPKILFSLEDLIRNKIKENVSRGKLEVYINMKVVSNEDIDINLNLELAKKYYDTLSTLSSAFDLGEKISLKDLYLRDGVIEVNQKDQDSTLYKEYVISALNQAIFSLIEMKSNEGNNLKLSLIDDLNKLQTMVNTIKKIAPNVIKENIEKLETKISNLIPESNLDLPRLTTELVIIADKLAIDEEIDRLNSHIKQFNTIINKDEPIGRKLDFLIQEINREINTIGSKSTNIEILGLVVEMKSQVEKLREQIQNIE